MHNNMAILFDMDGVLLDSNKLVADSFDAQLKAYGISVADVKDEDGDGYKGRSLRDFLAAIKEQYGHDIDLDDFSAKAGNWAFDEMERTGLRPDTSLIALLKALQAAGVKIGIGTSSLRWRTDKILKILGIAKYFEAVVTADEVTEHKPNPHIYLEAARQLGVEAAKCIVIEDADSGVEAARRANMKVVGFAKYDVPDASLQDVDLRATDWSELTVDALTQLVA